MRGFHAEWRVAFGVGRDGGLGARFGDVDGDGRSCRRIEHMDVAGDSVSPRIEAAAMGQMNVVVVDEGLGDSDKGDVAGEAAIVEPVDADRGNAVDKASGVHSDDNEVRSRMQDGR